MLDRVRAAQWHRGSLVLATFVVAALVALAPRPAPVWAAAGEAIGWPESHLPVQDGGAVTLGEYFSNGPHAIPCESDAAATVVLNGLSSDSLSAQEPSLGWFECGPVTVTNGFTTVTLSQQEARATAEPEITLTEPGGCVYGLGSVNGHEALAGFVAYEFAATATLKTGAACADTLEVKGSFGVYGPQSGGIGLAPWVLSSEPEREALERATHERENEKLANAQNEKLANAQNTKDKNSKRKNTRKNNAFALHSRGWCRRDDRGH